MALDCSIAKLILLSVAPDKDLSLGIKSKCVVGAASGLTYALKVVEQNWRPRDMDFLSEAEYTSVVLVNMLVN
jgi:hypothetical protein